MYTVDDILSRLNKGEDSAAIAQEMADLLNQAIAQKDAQDKKAAETARRKVNIANDIADRINAFFAEFYPIATTQIKGDDIIAIGEDAQWLKDLLTTNDNGKNKDKTPDEIIADFLKDFNL